MFSIAMNGIYKGTVLGIILTILHHMCVCNCNIKHNHFNQLKVLLHYLKKIIHLQFVSS